METLTHGPANREGPGMAPATAPTAPISTAPAIREHHVRRIVEAARDSHAPRHQGGITRRPGPPSGSAAGRKLEKPVLHYTLSWGKDERPDRADMNRAAEETLKALGLERHQALIVAHRDKDMTRTSTWDREPGAISRPASTAKLGNDRLKLSRWAELLGAGLRGQVK